MQFESEGQLGFVVTDSGLMMKTTDAGNTWTTVSPIPAGSGDGEGGKGRVDYYVSAAFSGLESQYASPIRAMTSNR